jgi:ferric-dicitrate binding protein FerR (iron transport regulator)
MEEVRLKKYDLIVQSIYGELQEDEQRELDEWLNESDNNRRLFDDYTNEEYLINRLKEFDEVRKVAEIVEQQVLQAYFKDIVSISPRYSWMRALAVAVCLVLVVLPILYHLVKQPKPSTQIVTNNKTNKQQDTTNIHPGTEKATLTLADGMQIILDSAADGQIAQQGNTIINSNNGKLEYKTGDHKETAILYNALTTAKGETYQIILSDGSKVWLNAESSIRYPVGFTGKERRVTVTGEVYFEVEKDKNHPFYVSISDIRSNAEKAVIEVIGTHFNINSYNDEDVMKTTLLEGSVKVWVNENQVRINRGQQAVISSVPASGINSTKEVIKIDKNVDTSQVVAWKDGDFDFNNCDLKTVMRQVARWYNLQVVYPTAISSEKFIGKIHRNTRIAGVLAILDSTSSLHFKIEGRKIIVKP